MQTSTRTQSTPPVRARRRGFSLVESMLCIVLFGIILMLFGVTFPAMIRGSDKSASYSQAALLAQHKIDQLRQVGYAQLQDTAVLRSLGVIDTNLNGDGSFAFTLVDNLVDNNGKKGFFGPSGSASSSIVVGQALTGQGGAAPSTLRALGVTVTIRWTGTTARVNSCTMHTIIAAP